MVEVCTGFFHYIEWGALLEIIADIFAVCSHPVRFAH